MSKSITFKSEDPTSLISWLKKFSSIESSLLIEIDGNKKAFTAKSYNTEKSIVKFSSISFEDAKLELQKDFSGLIKLGIYNLVKLIKSLEQFKNKEFEINVKYDKAEEDLAGLSILIKNQSLKIKINGSSLSIFKYITNKLFKENIMFTEEKAKIDFSLNHIEEIYSLLSLDKDYKFFDFVSRNDKIYVKGSAFELEIGEAKGEPHMISVFKEQFEKVDKENYKITLGDDKIIFNSYDTDTITVLSMVVRDNNYDEESTDFE